MMDANGIRKYRTAAEQDARAGADRGDFEVWLRAIGKITALDDVLGDEEEPASERVPFPYPHR